MQRKVILKWGGARANRYIGVPQALTHELSPAKLVLQQKKILGSSWFKLSGAKVSRLMLLRRKTVIHEIWSRYRITYQTVRRMRGHPGGLKRYVYLRVKIVSQMKNKV